MKFRVNIDNMNFIYNIVVRRCITSHSTNFTQRSVLGIILCALPPRSPVVSLSDASKIVQNAGKGPFCSALQIFTYTCSRTLHSSYKCQNDSKPENILENRGMLKDGEFPEKVTDEEWRQRLTEQQYYICRQHGTEMPFSGVYLYNKKAGIYCCVCCGSELFSSSAKYESHSGWPSFFEAIDEGSLIHRVDKSCGMTRIEVICRKCNCHLGHVFADGPEPRGQRYCINSVSLNFKPHFSCINN